MTPADSGWARLILVPYAGSALLAVHLAPRAFPEALDPPLLLAALVVAGAAGRAAGPGKDEPPLATWRLPLGLTLAVTFLYALFSTAFFPYPAWPLVPEEAMTLIVHSLPSLPGVAVLLVLAGLAIIPHVATRAGTAALGAQVASGALSGLAIGICLTWGADRAEAFVFLTTSAFAVLGAGAHHMDRALGNAEVVSERTPRDLILSFAAVALLSLSAAWTTRLAFPPLLESLQGERSPAVEELLLQLQHDVPQGQVQGRFVVASLTEVPKLDPDLAVGFKDGYLFRYAYFKQRKTWSVCADPADGEGVHYRIRNEGPLQRSHRPFPDHGH